MVKFDDLIKQAQEKIEQIVDTAGIPKKDVMKQFNIVYNIGFIAAAETEELRQNWAVIKLSGDHFNRPKLEERDIVVLGFSGVTKFGANSDPFIDVFAYEVNTEKLISIRLDKDHLAIVDELTLGEYYPEIKIAVTDRGNFSIDERSKIPEPETYIGAGEDYPETLDELLTDVMGIKTLQMKDFGNANKLSKRTAPGKDGRNWVINTSWVCVRNCIIQNYRKHPVKGMDGVARYNLTVSDTTVPEDITTAKGVIIPKIMGVWADSRYAYPNFSMVNIWGTLEHRTWNEKDRDNPGKEIKRQNFQMNGYYIFPVGLGPSSEESN